MAKYALGFSKGSASVQQMVEALADATRPRRGKLVSFSVGYTTASDDGVTDYQIRRVTGSATGSSLTPNPLDPADAATEFDAKDTVTVDAASYAAGTLLDRLPLNNRATWQWMAGQGSELVYPATASNGLSLGASAATTKTYVGRLIIDEQ